MRQVQGRIGPRKVTCSIVLAFASRYELSFMSAWAKGSKAGHCFLLAAGWRFRAQNTPSQRRRMVRLAPGWEV